MSIIIRRKMKIAGVGEDMEKWETLCMLVGMCNGVANVANSLAVPQKEPS